MDKILSAIQPNAGWGNICVDCPSCFCDFAKYEENFSPDYPCKLVVHAGPSASMPDLVRYTDGSESCNRYKRGQLWKAETRIS